MIQFYIPDIESTSTLPETESGHCVRVLRMNVGDNIICVDGKGGRYVCRITEAHPKHCGIEILSKEEIPNHWGADITLCFAPTKNLDRIEWMAEKCTEMGVNTFIPVKCTRSERKELKTPRLERIIVSAMKQSLKATMPVLEEMKPLEQVLRMPFKGQKFICYCSSETDRKEFAKEYIPGSDVAILIGPEGDFSPEEVKMAIKEGWVPAVMGGSRLRTETAGMVAVSEIHTINQLNS